MQPAKDQILSEVQQCLWRPSDPSQGAVALQTSQVHLLQPCLQPRRNKKTPITWDWPHNIGLFVPLAAFVLKAVVVLPVPIGRGRCSAACAPSPAARQQQRDKNAREM